MIDRNSFFERVRQTLFDGRLKASAKDTLGQMLDYWQAQFPRGDQRWLAYAFATAHHETDRSFGPIREYGRGKGKRYAPYYGRGLVQLTWDYNYKKMGEKIGVDLLHHPDAALEVKNAIPVLFIGMRDGLFTGKKFADYFHAGKADWINARRIINGTDKAALIAGYGKAYDAALRQNSESLTPVS